MGKKVVKLKRADGVVQGYHVGSDLKPPTPAESIAAHPAGKGLQAEDSFSDKASKFENSVKKAEVGTHSNGTEFTPVEIPEGQLYKNMLEQAETDGWKVFGGPWGAGEGDRSVRIEKYFPEHEGKITMHVVDRDFKLLPNSPAAKIHGDFVRDTNISAWFVGDTKPGFANPEHSLHVGDAVSTDELSEEALISKAGTCDKCGKNVGPKNLQPVAFANAFCKECAPGAREQMEKPGWYN